MAVTGGLMRLPFVLSGFLLFSGAVQLQAEMPALSKLTDAGVKQSGHFEAVVKELQLGGSSFSYSDQEGIWKMVSSVADEIVQALPAEAKKEMPADFSVQKLFDVLGVHAIQAVGSSTAERTDASGYHSRTYIHLPKGRPGLLSILGEKNRPQMMLDLAPESTDLGMDQALTLKGMRPVLTYVESLLPERDKVKMKEALAQKIPQLGDITVQELLEKLDLRLGLYLRADLTKTTTIPTTSGNQELPDADGMIVIEGAGWIIKKLKPQLLSLVQGMQSQVDYSEEGPLMTVAAKAALMPAPMDYQPMLQYDADKDQLILTSRKSFKSGGFRKRPNFAQSWKNLPLEGTGSFFCSGKLLKDLPGYVTKVASTHPQAEKDALDIMKKAAEWLSGKLNQDQVVAVTLLKEGTLTASNASIPLGDQNFMNSGMSVSYYAVLAGIALPAFSGMKAQSELKQQQEAEEQNEPDAEAVPADDAEEAGKDPL
jgi:hypothetical protein